MKNKILVMVVACIAFLIFTGCEKSKKDSGLDGDPSGYDSLPAGQGANAGEVSEQDPEEVTIGDKILMVMVNGKLYYDTGKESTLDVRCGMADGEIISTVDGSESPAEDDQSNFGTGFEYQYGTDDTIEIFMNDKWIVFECGEGTVDTDALAPEH